MYSFIVYNGLLINKRFFEFLKNNNLADFESLMNFDGGQLLKKNEFRSIIKIKIKDKTIYLKRHFWPWKERIKSIIPWVQKEDAKNEWENMLLLNDLGFNTMVPVAFGEKKRFGMSSFSMTLTENIYDAEKLETYLPRHFTPPLSGVRISEKRALIKKLAALARDLHNNGLNHQDFYLGHLFIRSEDDTIFIVDLQRMHRRELILRHDMIKDIAQIAYSAAGLGIFDRTDFMRFAHSYFGRNKLTKYDKKLFKKIMAKVKRIARHDARLQRRKNKAGIN